MVDIDLFCLDPVHRVRIDEDNFHFDSFDAISEIRNLQSHYDDLLAMAASESDDDDLSFQLDPIDGLINKFDFDEWDEDLDVPVGPIEDLLDHICNSSPQTIDVEQPTFAFDEFESAPCRYGQRKVSCQEPTQSSIDNSGCRKRSNIDIKKDALYKPLQYIYSLRYQIMFETQS